MMGGFFSSSEIPDNHQIKAPTCSACDSAGSCESPKIKMGGQGRKGIYIVGAKPSEHDDAKGEHFVGKVGTLLTKILKRSKIDLHKDCYLDYALCCRTKGDKPPTSVQIQACNNRLMESIYETKPSVIILMGAAAVEAVIGNTWGKDLGAIDKWRGFVIPDRKLGAWICPVYDPSFVVSSTKKAPVLDVIYRNDISAAVKHVGIDFPKIKNEEECIKYLWTEDEQVAWFMDVVDRVQQGNLFLAFDYEGTGLKPYADGHAIACCSMCIDENEAVVFPFPLGAKATKWFKRVLTHKRILKLAHNMKFEALWTKQIQGFDVFPWGLCSMQAAHVLDNRPYIAGLKFQTYIHFGMAGYDDDITPYLKSGEKSANAINRVFEAPAAKLLLYCGIDSLVQFRLAMKQLLELDMMDDLLSKEY